jgi:hypothetical protein
MAKYKNLKSAIHNWADSFLSIQNINSKNKYLPKVLCDAAKSNKTNKVVLNLLTTSLSPQRVSNPDLITFTQHCPWSFAKLLISQNIELSMVSSARLEVVYDFEAELGSTEQYLFSTPESAPIPVKYSATVIAIDDRGIQHSAVVREWWR